MKKRPTEQLVANGCVEADLLPLLEKGMRANALTADITRIDGEIESLGAVNLAALSELGTSRERKDHSTANRQI